VAEPLLPGIVPTSRIRRCILCGRRLRRSGTPIGPKCKNKITARQLQALIEEPKK
jgi:hypothetical protein